MKGKLLRRDIEGKDEVGLADQTNQTKAWMWDVGVRLGNMEPACLIEALGSY